MKTVEVKDRAAWRAWLAANHDTETEIWLVYYKKASGKPSLDYGETVEEALCYGWVDSLIKKLGKERYVRKFTPRKDNSQWSPSNIRRVEKMIKAGLMTEFGMKKVDAAKNSGEWDQPVQKPMLGFDMPEEFSRALKDNPAARHTFDNLAPTYQKQYLGWIITAKRAETREKRIQESIQLLARGEKLGLR
jgi:uncharacterized protein YdeI (YjbR/CyaY-like superfamily)